MMNTKTKAISIVGKNSFLKATLMALMMSSIMSIAMTSLNVYLQCEGNTGCVQEAFFTMWLGSFLTSFALGLPIALLVSPLVARIADKIAPN
ncbi:MAG: DUF2798 domain-containing protein [Thermoproteota archaeon]|jgi:Protein of unknown function (DUF2798)|nr:DUF2798 domain-containing protein [Thermoproteota archaeon]